MMFQILKNTMYATKVLTAIEASPQWRELFPTGRQAWPIIQGIGMEKEWRELIDASRVQGTAVEAVADFATDEILDLFLVEAGLTIASKKKHVLPNVAYQSDDPATAFKMLHIFAAHKILDACNDNADDRDAGAIFAVTSRIGSTVAAARKSFPDRTPPVEGNSLFSRLATVGSVKGNGAKFPPISPLVASLQEYHGDSDLLVPLIMGAYAPSAVRQMFADILVNPPNGTTPDHLRQAAELRMAATRIY